MEVKADSQDETKVPFYHIQTVRASLHPDQFGAGPCSQDISTRCHYENPSGPNLVQPGLHVPRLRIQRPSVGQHPFGHSRCPAPFPSPRGVRTRPPNLSSSLPGSNLVLRPTTFRPPTWRPTRPPPRNLIPQVGILSNGQSSIQEFPFISVRDSHFSNDRASENNTISTLPIPSLNLSTEQLEARVGPMTPRVQIQQDHTPSTGDRFHSNVQESPRKVPTKGVGKHPLDQSPGWNLRSTSEKFSSPVSKILTTSEENKEETDSDTCIKSGGDNVTILKTSSRLTDISNATNCLNDISNQTGLLYGSTIGPAHLKDVSSSTPHQRKTDLELENQPQSEECVDVMVFDSHCHIDRIYNKWRRERNSSPLRSLVEEFPDVFGDRFEGCITVNCDPKRWQPEKWEWLTMESNVWLTFGCHPNKSDQYDDYAEDLLMKALNHPKNVALGEIGLDSFCTVHMETQKMVFKRQLQIAKNLNLSVCLHIRGPVSLAKESHAILKDVLPRDWPIHMHCFFDNWEICLKWITHWPNMIFGITPDHYKTDFVMMLPLDKLILETDAPYLVPRCAKRKFQFSLPGMVSHTAEQVAKIKNVPVDVVLAKSRDNVEKLYKISRHAKYKL